MGGGSSKKYQYGSDSPMENQSNEVSPNLNMTPVSNERSGPCFSDTIHTKNKIATKKEVEELLKLLGGFEKWHVLNEDCRREVVKYLDYESRFNLSICSKNDHETVEKTKIYVESVEILDNQKFHEEFDNVTVVIRLPDGNYSLQYKWVFSQLEQDTRVEWPHYISPQHPVPKEVIWKSCNYLEEAVKFAEKWMKKSNFEMEEVTIEMVKYPFATSQIKSFACCRDMRVRSNDLDSIEWWLKKCPEQLEQFHVYVYGDRKSFTLPSDFLNEPKIMQASRRISFGCRAAFSDEQLLKLKSKTIWFDSVDVTDRGINKFIENWVHGKSVPGFKEAHISAATVRDPEEIIAGLDYFEWDEAFKKDHSEFVEHFNLNSYSGLCYQIKSKVNPFESLSLGVDENRVSISATGIRAEHNGEAYTHYRIPNFYED
ncbi:unnamed protein product [Caenorhabditis brenneri]